MLSKPYLFHPLHFTPQYSTMPYSYLHTSSLHHSISLNSSQVWRITSYATLFNFIPTQFIFTPANSIPSPTLHSIPNTPKQSSTLPIHSPTHYTLVSLSLHTITHYLPLHCQGPSAQSGYIMHTAHANSFMVWPGGL